MSGTQVTDIHNYRAVDSRLSTSGQPTERQLAAAARAGFCVILNLALHDDPRYSLRDEPGYVKSLGMEYIHIPVQFDAPTENNLLAFFAALEKHQGQKILMHCAANMRVTAFLGLYQAIKQNKSVEEAFALMKTVWEPNPTWLSFIAAMLAKHRD
ncbi:MAG TPA: protein tyrosine phosphatase family protein [Gammaproteobacteria bacterium]|nr:protein tyrosine phosphatase family protein [Gammaproteobacteria bacterium]